jgi:hypothetical protein
LMLGGIVAGVVTFTLGVWRLWKELST